MYDVVKMKKIKKKPYSREYWNKRIET